MTALLAVLAGGCSTPTVGGPCDVFEIDGQPGQACGQQLYFPTGLAIDKAATRLYVSNGNADLRYAGGTVQAIDLTAFQCAYGYARRGTWDTTSCDLSKAQWSLLKCAMDYAQSGTDGFGAIPDGCDAATLNQIYTDANKARVGRNGLCRADLLDPAIIECDEQLLIAGALTHGGSPNHGSVRVGNFAGTVRLQPKVGGGATGRLWLAVRGDPSITYININDPLAAGAMDPHELDCGASTEPNLGLPEQCKTQQITVRDFHDSLHPECSKDANMCVNIPAEPFGIAFDEGSYESPGNGICYDGSPCDNANPCLEGACLTVGQCKIVEGRGPDACLTTEFCRNNVKDPNKPLDSYCMYGVCPNRARCASNVDCAGSGTCRFARGTRYQHVLVSHLLTGEVTLIDASVANPASTADVHPTEPVVLDVRGVGFSGDSAGRALGFGLAAREPGNPRSLWYATSRNNARIALFRVGFSNVLLPFSLVPLVGPFNAGDDVRDITFDPCTDRGPGNAGCRAFAIQNHPPSLFTIDTRIDPLRVPAGSPQNVITDAVSVCQAPSHLAFQSIADPLGGPRRNRVYVLCYGANQMAVVDPDLSLLVDSVLVGRGPNEIVFNFDGDAAPADEPRAFVTNFLDNSISVVDLQPGSRFENHVVARIGFTEPPRLQ